MENQEQLFFWFMAVWVGISLIGIWLFQISKDIERKQRLIRSFIIGTGVLFAGFSLYMMRSADVAFFIIPAVVPITWRNLRNMKICGSCGKFLNNAAIWTKMEYCSKCGASLSDTDPKCMLQ